MSTLQHLVAGLSSAVEKRLFAEYGSIFVTRAISPPRIIFSDAEQVESFQSTLPVSTSVVGEHPMTLQQVALEALLAAVGDARAAGLSISARSADSGARSYDDTVKLWLRNVTRGLDHWVEKGQLQPDRADEIRQLNAVDQVPVILDLDPSVEEAAWALGASRARTFVSVILPALVPAMLTGFALSFARALGEYGSVVFISGNLPLRTEIVPLLIVTKLEQYDYAGATAMAVVMLSASFAILLAINALENWTRRSKRRR